MGEIEFIEKVGNINYIKVNGRKKEDTINYDKRQEK